MIKKEINNLEDDIKQNEQILTWLNKMDDKSVNRGKREKRGLGGGFGVGPPVYSQNRRLPPSQMGAQMGAYLPPIVPQSPVMPGPRQGRYFKALEGFNLIKIDYSNSNFKFTNYFLKSLNFFTIFPSGCYLQQKSIFRLIYIKKSFNYYI